jgi:hypothetical protein
MVTGGKATDVTSWRIDTNEPTSFSVVRRVWYSGVNVWSETTRARFEKFDQKSLIADLRSYLKLYP